MSLGRPAQRESETPDGGTPGFDSAVVLSPFFWNVDDDIPGTTHHIAAELGRLYPTMFVEPAPQWNMRSEQFRIDRLVRGLGGHRTNSVSGGLTVFHRRALPFGRFKAVREWGLRGNGRALRHVLAGRNFRRTLLWHSFPYWSEPLVQSIDHSVMVYHCLDFTTRTEEERLVGQADVVFGVSEALVSRLRELNPHAYHLPNGVDLDLFDSQHVRQEARPLDLPTGTRLIGLVGTVNRHLDIELIVRVAQAFPRETIVVVGSITTGEKKLTRQQLPALRTLESLRNVRLLGFRPPRAVPRYVQAFDVCLIPYLGDRFNQERDPLKFYEYLALGKSVVTTHAAVADRYPDLCYPASSSADFISRVGEALEAPPNMDVQRGRMALAGSHGWRMIVAAALCRIRAVRPF